MEGSRTDSVADGMKSERRRVIRIALSLVGLMLAIEGASMSYLVYILGLYRDTRWVPLVVSDFVAAIPLVGIMVLLCLRWARGSIEFGRVILAGGEPSRKVAENAVRSVFIFARNGGLLFAGLYSFSAVLILSILYKWYGYSRLDIVSIGIFKFITGLNLGMILYYAIKIIEQFQLEKAAEKLFGMLVFEWPHFKFSIRYKIFLIILVVFAYILASAVFMGMTQAENIQRMQLQDNLEYWANGISKYLAETVEGGGGSTGSKQPVYSYTDDLSANSRLLVLDSSGEAVHGDISLLSAGERQKIVSDRSPGFITDYSHKKVTVYKPNSKSGFIVATVGYWGVSSAMFAKTRNTALALLVATILLSIVATYLLVSDINTPLDRVLEFLKAIARGETERALNTYSEDEMGDFARELARTTVLLEGKTKRANQLLSRIKEVAIAIEDNAARVQAAAQQQASGVSEQASSVEQALSASNEIVAAARQIAENAADVQKTAEENLLSCKIGNDRIAEALDGFKSLGKYVEEISSNMVSLGEDIRKITGIIQIIEEVAVQINLLALNAQIEAAGAGEEGNRFRVVAEEIRRLADNTMDAVKRISILVKSTLKAGETAVQSAQKGAGLVGKSAELADEIGRTFKEIEQQADLTEMTARKISITTTQQKTASEQMAATISDIHTSAQQIKTNTEHVLKAMAELAETSASLTLEFREEG